MTVTVSKIIAEHKSEIVCSAEALERLAQLPDTWDTFHLLEAYAQCAIIMDEIKQIAYLLKE